MRLYYLALTILVLYISIINNTNAQTTTNGISATTNKPSYQLGDKVIITGSVENVVTGNPVTILVRNPIGNVYEVGQVNLLDNLFVHDFVLSEDAQGGTYTVEIKHGNQTGEIRFVVEAGPVQIITVDGNSIKIRGNNTIGYSNVRVSSTDKSLTIALDTTKLSGSSLIQEFQIPKVVIDNETGNLWVQIDGANWTCNQSETNTTRILDCAIPPDAKELKIIGTTIIPEFGPLAALVLTAGISSLIAYNKIKIR